jgi:PAS domain S-box-containing protein
MFELTLIPIVLFITTAINVVVSFIGWRRRGSKVGWYFAMGMISITFWTLAAGLGYMVVPLDLKILFAKFDAIGYNFGTIFFFIAILHLAGFDAWADDKRARFFVFLLPVTNILFTVTNEWHGWVWTGFTPVGNNIYIFEHGPAFTWINFIAYVIIICIIAILLWMVRKGSVIQKRQARLLILATLFLLGANIAYLYGFPGFEGVDWSSVTFSITGVFFLWALQSARLIDLIPIARDKIMSSLRDGVIVVDAKSRIIDVNPAVATLLVITAVSLAGKDLQEVMPPAHSWLSEASGQEFQTDFETASTPKQYFDVRISPIYDHTQTHQTGSLIVFHNITQRKQNEVRLQQLNKELSEAQAQVISQQRALASVEERQRLGRNLHDSVNQSIHSLMLFSDTLIFLLENGQTEQAIRAAERIHASGEQALREVRLLVHEGQAVVIGGISDLIEAVEKRLDMVERRAGIRADFLYDLSALERVPTEWMENIYWIILEGLNNSLKHSRASEVLVTIAGEADQLRVEIKDNGAGFAQTYERGGGVGMKSMRERAEMLGGMLSVESSPEQGTRVQCVVEIPKE